MVSAESLASGEQRRRLPEQDPLGLANEIISERRATSNRNAGDITRVRERLPPESARQQEGCLLGVDHDLSTSARDYRPCDRLGQCEALTIQHQTCKKKTLCSTNTRTEAEEQGSV